MKTIVLLTGERGVGKTRVCQRVVEQAVQRGYRCAGVLSRTVLAGEEKVAIALVDVATNAEKTLAVADDMPGGVRWGRYRFVPATLEWGSELLSAAAPCDLLVLDELGPLELTLGQGLVAALQVLEEGAFALALVVVRAELVDALREQLHYAEVRVMDVDPQNRGGLPGEILSLLAESIAKPDLPLGTGDSTVGA